MVAMLISLEAGRRFGTKKGESESDASASGKKIVEAAFLGLLSLLIAFSFSGAISRFDHRRALIVEEANDIGTAYLRVDLLSPSAQPKVRELFKEYLESRLATYEKLPDVDAAMKELEHTAEIQKHIWDAAVEGSRLPDSHPNAGVLLLGSLNSMIDITNTRTWAAFTHPPMIIFFLLFIVAIVCAFIAGESLSAAQPPAWRHMISFALIMCISVFVILEIEYPRIGFVSIEKYDKALYDLRKEIK